jgi:hypothetical protein
MSQAIVVVHILVAQRQSKHPLTHQRAHRVLYKRWIAPVDETSRQPLDQPYRCIGLAQ